VARPVPEVGRLEKPTPPGDLGGSSAPPSTPAVKPGIEVPTRRKVDWRQRLIVSAIIALIAATGAWSWWRSRISGFTAVLESATEAGTNALEAGDWSLALTELSKAEEAARGIPGTSPVEQLAEHYFLEAHTWSRLAADSLDGMFKTLETGGRLPEEGVVQARFGVQFRGRTLVIQDYLSRVTFNRGPDGVTRPTLDAAGRPHLDWVHAGQQYRVELNAADVALFEILATKDPLPIVFGAELDGIRRDPEHADRWLVDFVPNRVVLLTVAAPFRKAGWPDVEAISDLLNGQRELANLPAATLGQSAE
jgi:hypothetical protein